MDNKTKTTQLTEYMASNEECSTGFIRAIANTGHTVSVEDLNRMAVLAFHCITPLPFSVFMSWLFLGLSGPCFISSLEAKGDVTICISTAKEKTESQLWSQTNPPLCLNYASKSDTFCANHFNLIHASTVGSPLLWSPWDQKKKKSLFERYHHFRDEFTERRYACDI